MGTVFIIIFNGNLDGAATGTCGAFVAFFTFFAFRTSYTRVTFFAFRTITNNGCCCGAIAVGNSKSVGAIIVIGHRCCNALAILTIFTFQTFIDITFGINLKFIGIVTIWICSHF